MTSFLRQQYPRTEQPKPNSNSSLEKETPCINLNKKEYADTKRSAEHSIIQEGDEILLKQTRENKLDTNFEPTPYNVVQKDGNALLLENEEGVRKMRNVVHVKKLVKQSSNNGPAEKIPINSTLPVLTPQTPTKPQPVGQRNAPFRFKDYILV